MAVPSTLGVLLKNAGGRVIVDAVDPASPNAAVVRGGDVLIAVNGINVLGLPLASVKPLLAGHAGVVLRVSVLRPEGEAVLELVRHSSGLTRAVEGAGGAGVAPLDLMHMPQMASVPLHKLVLWDTSRMRQVAMPWPKADLQQPDGFLDVTIVDVENLPVCYEIGWSLAAPGTATASPYVEVSVDTCKLRTSSQAGKLSAAVNQTLRLPVVDTSPLCIRVMNDDLSVGGNVIGELRFPMQQMATEGFRQKGRFRLTVAPSASARVPTLAHLDEGDEVTGLKHRPSTVHVELAYRGRPFSALVVDEDKKQEVQRVMRDRAALEQQHAALLEARRLAVAEERAVSQRAQREQAALAQAVVLKAQREAKVREEVCVYVGSRACITSPKHDAGLQTDAGGGQVYAVSRSKLASEREAWLLSRRAQYSEASVPTSPPDDQGLWGNFNSSLRSIPMPSVSLPDMPAMPELPGLPPMSLPDVNAWAPARQQALADFEPDAREMQKAVERRSRLRELTRTPGEAHLFECVLLPDADVALRAMAAAGYEIVLVAVGVPWVAAMVEEFLRGKGIVGAGSTAPINDGNLLFCQEPAEKAVVVNRMGGFVAAVERSFSCCQAIQASNPEVHTMLFNADAENEAGFEQAQRVNKADRYAMHQLVQQYGALLSRQRAGAHAPGVAGSGPAQDQDAAELRRLDDLIKEMQRKVLAHASAVKGDGGGADKPWLQVCDKLQVPPTLVGQFQGSVAAGAGGTGGAGGYLYPLAASDDEATLSSLSSGALPEGWEPVQDKETGRWFFINHKAKTSSWLQPAHAADDKRAAAWLQRARRTDPHDLTLGEEVGVGLSLGRDSSGHVRVTAVQDGGAAQRSGRVGVDDVVVSIDGVAVGDAGEHELRRRLLGAVKTSVVLGVQPGSRRQGEGGRRGGGLSWHDIVTLAQPDPQGDPSVVMVHGMRVTAPAEDAEGVFVVRAVDTQVLVGFRV